MKKYNEGYTLPFVLVVFLIISLVAVSIVTVAVHNLHGQKESVKRMQAQYVAQGAVEAVVAQLTDVRTMTAFQSEVLLTEDAARMKIITGKVDDICAKVYGTEGSNTVSRDLAAAPGYTETENDQFVYSFNIVSVSGNITVTSRIELSGTFKASEQTGETILYTVENPKVTFITYQIMTANGNGGGK